MSTQLETPTTLIQEQEHTTATSEVIGMFIEKLKESIKNSKDLVQEAKAISQEVKFLEREHKKYSKKRKAPRVNSKPSGLEKLVKISEPLAAFLNEEASFEISRIEAVKRIYAYIDEHNLKDKNNGRIIILDGEAGQKLRTILNTNLEKKVLDDNKVETGETYNVLERDGLQIFNIQSFIKHHFNSISNPLVKIENTESEPVTTATSTPVVKTKKTKKTKKTSL